MLAFFNYKHLLNRHDKKFLIAIFCLLPTAYCLLITSSRGQMYQKYHES